MLFIDFIVIPQLVSAEQRKTTQSDTISWSLNFPIFWGDDDLAEGKLPRRKQNFAAWWLANSLALSGVYGEPIYQ